MDISQDGIIPWFILSFAKVAFQSPHMHWKYVAFDWIDPTVPKMFKQKLYSVPILTSNATAIVEMDASIGGFGCPTTQEDWKFHPVAIAFNSQERRTNMKHL